MFRKIALFLLFCLASPAWLIMRSRYGSRFLSYLFIAWTLTAGLTYLLRSVILNPDYAPADLYLIDQWALAAGVIYPFSGLLWSIQGILLLLHSLAVGTGDSTLPRPWYTGAFPLFVGTPRIIDHVAILGACFLTWTFWYAPAATFERGFALTLVPIIAAFGMLAHSLRWNDNTLPFSDARPKQPRPEKQRVTRVAPKPRSQDGLAEVFSRRDPALARITASQHG